MKSRHIESSHPLQALLEKVEMPAGLGARYFGPDPALLEQPEGMGNTSVGLKLRYRSQKSGASRCEFLVWAPSSKQVGLSITAPKKKFVPLVTDGSGYHWTVLSDVKPGTEYFFRLNGGLERPDPASRCQPRGAWSLPVICTLPGSKPVPCGRSAKT